MSLVDMLHSKLGLQGIGSPHISIGIAAFFVCALVVSVVLLFIQKGGLNKGVVTYAKFVYASFLKPHERDQAGQGGQQHALESFYRTQVWADKQTHLCINQSHADSGKRQTSMMRPERHFSVAARICSGF
jgi:hypothetical protein